MATGRTTNRWTRVYCGGYDLSGNARTIGPLVWTFAEADLTCMADAVKGYLPDVATLGVGTLNGVMDNTAVSGLHTLLSAGAGTKQSVMVAPGIRGEPANGDSVYVGEFELASYMLEPASNGVYVNLAFDAPSSSNTTLLYNKPYGTLLHAKLAATEANTAVGFDDNGGASAFGGYMMYQIFAGDGNATINVQDAAANLNASFGDLSGATTGNIDCSSPSAGIVAIGRTATVKQYLRWQVTLDTASTVTFALAFVRATN